MRLHGPSPPQGKNGRSLLFSLLPPHIQYSPPQGIDGGVAPPSGENPLLAIYPDIADATFQFYKFYQIKKSQVPSLQTNEPLVIIDTLGSGILQQVSGFDIKAFDGQTLLEIPYEREFVDPVTGDFIIHLKPDTVQDSNFVQLVFGKPATTDISTTILDSEYDIFYRMNQTTFGAGSTLDSSPNNRNGTPNGTISSITGQIGLGLNGNGANDSRIITTSPPILGTEFTISFWCNPNALNSNDNFCGAFRLFPSDPGWGFGTPIPENGMLQFSPDGITPMPFTNSSIVIGVWQHLVLVLKDNLLSLYYNGVFVESVALSTAIINTSEFAVLGMPINGTTQFNTKMDQFSIQNVAITADEVKTRYNNEVDNDAFWFKTKLFENGVNIFLIDDNTQKRKIEAVI